MKNLKLLFTFLFFISFSQNGFSNVCPVDFWILTDAPICNGESSGNLMVEIETGEPPFLYSFDGGNTFSTENILENIPAGTYDVVVRDANNCEGTTTQILLEPPLFQVDIGQDILINLGDDIYLEPLASAQFQSFEWTSTVPNSIPDFAPINLSFSPLESQTVIFTAFNLDGCKAEDAVRVTVKKPLAVFIPNIFTPNGDGFNDSFTVFGGPSILQILTFQITSPWNEIVFEAKNFLPNDPVFGWDGRFKNKLMNEGVFMYCVEFQYIDGEIKIICGDVTLMR